MGDNRKQYKYTIREFANLLGLSKQAIYNYEKEGKIPPAKREKKGRLLYRYYTDEDVYEARKQLNLIPKLQNKPEIHLFLNFKGGTGKSTISSNYAYRLAQYGYRVLAIDLDPQGHLTKCLGYNPYYHKTLYEILIEKQPISNIINKSRIPTLNFIAANLNLAPIELALVSLNAREYRLFRALKEVRDKYDIIILDAPPNQGLLNLNAILASTHLLIPVLSDFLSYDGLAILFDTLSSIREDYEYEIKNIHIILNNFIENQIICQEARAAISKNYPDYITDTIIRKNTDISKAQSSNKTIFEYKPNSNAGKDIDNLVREIFKMR